MLLDVLAMCALQFASKVEQEGIDTNKTSEEMELRLKNLDAMLSKHLG